MDKKQNGGFYFDTRRNNFQNDPRTATAGSNANDRYVYGYDRADIKRHIYASSGAPAGASGTRHTSSARASGAYNYNEHTDAYGRSGAVRGAPNVRQTGVSRTQNYNGGYGDGYYRDGRAAASSGAVVRTHGYHPTGAVRSPDDIISRRAPVQRGGVYSNGYGKPDNARRVVLTEQQRVGYERAYMQKHGTSPYVGNVSRMPEAMGGRPAREDRRQAFLRDEELRLRREAEALRAEQQRLREKQAEEQKRLREERRRREAAERRAADRRLREAEKRRLEAERRIVYEENKRKYEAARRAQAQRIRLEKRRALEKKLRRRHFARVVAFHLRVVLATFLVTVIVLGAFGYSHFWVDDSKYARSVTYTYGGETVSGVPKNTAYRDGVLCVDLIRVARLLDFYTVGDSERVSFFISDSSAEQYISVMPDSQYAEINGMPVLLSVRSTYETDSLWVSAEIMDFFEGGVLCVADKRSVQISKIRSTDEDGKYIKDEQGDYVYDPIVLSYKSGSAPEAPDLSVIYGDESLGVGLGTMVTFNAELEGFEHYMNPSDSTEYLTLVNKQNLLARDHIPEGLVDVAGVEGEGIQMRLFAAKSLEAMLTEMSVIGYEDITVAQGYLSYQKQLDRFNGYVAEEMAKGNSENEAMRLVIEYCPAPATDEHQTGLAVTLSKTGVDDRAFGGEEEYIWLKDNAWKFGYILRYPDGKEDITGYEFDPCHYRYVGRYAAEKIYRNEITLEEYLGGN